MFNSSKQSISSNSSNNNLTTLEEREKVIHDDLAQSLKNLSQTSDNYYVSYLRVCQAKEQYERSQIDLKNAELQCIQAKKRYDQVVSNLS